MRSAQSPKGGEVLAWARHGDASLHLFHNLQLSCCQRDPFAQALMLALYAMRLGWKKRPCTQDATNYLALASVLAAHRKAELPRASARRALGQNDPLAFVDMSPARNCATDLLACPFLTCLVLTIG